MLFDEIDSGISGQTASKVAGIFQEMGMQGQILAITHLPQVAAAGQHHWLVDKQGHGGQTETSLRILDKKDRQLEVARMLARRCHYRDCVGTGQQFVGDFLRLLYI